MLQKGYDLLFSSHNNLFSFQGTLRERSGGERSHSHERGGVFQSTEMTGTKSRRTLGRDLRATERTTIFSRIGIREVKNGSVKGEVTTTIIEDRVCDDKKKETDS